jgi:chromosome partitioning related protein ParA
MRAISVISTKGGVGKTTICANLAAFLADAGLRVLMLDLDTQPTLSSYFALTHQASGGIYELLANKAHNLEHLVSRTSIARLDVIVSNDEYGQLNTILKESMDGRVRLYNLMSVFAPHYDVVLIDTQGARNALLEAGVLASEQAISPITPEILSAREFHRGTLQLIDDIEPMSHQGLTAPGLHLLINRMPAVSTNARAIRDAVRVAFQNDPRVTILETEVPATDVFSRAATHRQAAHRLETRRPSGRVAPAALEIVCAMSTELWPEWREQFAHIRDTLTSRGNPRAHAA